jgi:plastocyanin
VRITRNLSTRGFATAASALGLMLWSVSPGATVRAAVEPKTHTVTVDALRFQPESLTIAAGDTVVWVNKDPFPHTATSKAGGFDSGEIATAESWKYSAVKKGEFEYICTLHPTMKGTIRVE